MQNKNVKIIAVIVVGLLAIGGLFAYRYWGELKGLFSSADEQIDLSWGNGNTDHEVYLACPTSTDAQGNPIVDAISTLTNYGPGTAVGVSFALYPSYVGPNPAIPIQEFPANSEVIISKGSLSADKKVWTLGDMAPGDSATIIFRVPLGNHGFNLETDTITPTDGDVDSRPGNYSTTSEDDNLKIGCAAEEEPPPPPPPGTEFDLGVTKSANPTTVAVGANTTFTVTLTNLSVATVPNPTSIVLTDTLPSTVTYVSHSASVGTFTPSTGLWNIPSLSGTTATLSLVVTVNSAGTHTNTVTITSSTPPDTNPANNTATATVTAGSYATPAVDDLVCSPANQTVAIEQAANFTVTGGTPAQATWSAPGGTPASGTGATFATKYTTSGSKVVTVSLQNDSATCNVTVSPPQGADLSLTKVVNVSSPQINTNVTYSVTVSNAGPAVAGTVTVKDVLPAGLTYLESDSTAGTYNSTTGIWTVGTLQVGSSATLKLVVKPTQTGTITNVAEVCSSDKPDPDSTPCNNVSTEDDQDSIPITVTSGGGEPQTADLSLSKSVSNSSPRNNTDIIYSVAVTNSGPFPAGGVTVKDVLPSGVTYKSSTASQGSYASGTGIWTVGSLAVGVTATLQLTVTVSASSGTVTNVAEVCASDKPDPDSTPCNNVSSEDDQDSVPFTVRTGGGGGGGGSNPRADLSLTKVVSNSAPKLGEQFIYTVSVVNDGPDNASNVTVKDILPTTLTFVKATASQGSYDKNTGIWTVGTVNDGASALLQITAKASTVENIINIAEVCSSSRTDPDSTPCNNVPTEDDYGTVTIRPVPGTILPSAGASSSVSIGFGLGSVLAACLIFFMSRSRKIRKRFGRVRMTTYTRY